VVPLDDRCLARAVEIGATFGVRVADAIHLAAADRLPAPVRYLTFERRQIPAAAALGFEVVSPLAG
jgi:predicted nucleic acid-binding protein